MPFKVDPTKIRTAADRAAEAAEAEARAAMPPLLEEMMDALAPQVPADLRTRWEEARSRARGRTEDGRPLVLSEPGT